MVDDVDREFPGGIWEHAGEGIDRARPNLSEKVGELGAVGEKGGDKAGAVDGALDAVVVRERRLEAFGVAVQMDFLSGAELRPGKIERDLSGAGCGNTNDGEEKAEESSHKVVCVP